MLKVKLFHSAFEDTPEYVTTFEFDSNMGYKQAAEKVYSATQNMSENGWGRDRGLNKDFRSTSVGDYVEVGGFKYYVAAMGFTTDPVDAFGRTRKSA